MSLDQGLVAVAKYDYVGFHLVNSLLEDPGKTLWATENVDHEDAQATELEGLHLVHSWRYIAFIDIARYCSHGSNPFKPLQHT